MASPENPHNFSNILTPSQWLTFYSITSTIISTLSLEEISTILTDSPPDIPQEHIRALALNEANYTNPRFKTYFEGVLAMLPAVVMGKFGVVLNLLNSIPGCLLLTYSITPFHLQPAKVREQLLLSWLNAKSTVLFPPIRAFTKTVVSITHMAWSKSIPQDVLYGAIGYVAKSGRSVDGGIIEEEDDGKRGFYKFKFMEFDTIKEGEEDKREEDKEARELECDVVIVGSGCGGAVVAKRLAEEGFKVIVVEKGIWYRTDQLPLPEQKAMSELFENNMVWPSDDGSLICVTGSTFGGGGAINWCASLQTQGYVREEWAKEHGLPFFLSNDYQDCLDYVCKRMGVTSNIVHNHRNSVILEGSRKLGYRAITVPQNTGAAIDGEDSSESANSSRMHSDGYCCFGCGCRESGEGRKMGTTQTWLPDAAKAGAEFIQDFYVERVLFSDSTKSKAIGVEGIWGKKKGSPGIKVTIKAKKVVISSGTMHSPCVLLRSGLTNPNIGKNLYVHPVSMLSAYFLTPTNPWEGSALTTACTEFENLDGLGHGVKIETSIMPPLVWMRPLPFHSSVQLKKYILNYRKAGSFICILKEKDTGEVYCDDKGLPRFKYTPSESDRGLLLKGVMALVKILYVQGAEEIVPYTAGMPPFKRHPSAAELEQEEAEEAAELETVVGTLFWSENLQPSEEVKDKLFEDPGINDKRFQRWLKKLENYGLPTPQAGFASAHQMGTCRMGSSEQVSVVDPRGRVWGTEGLYVSDASVFPSASGVNPMITTMAISHWIAGGLVKELRKEENRSGE